MRPCVAFDCRQQFCFSLLPKRNRAIINEKIDDAVKISPCSRQKNEIEKNILYKYEFIRSYDNIKYAEKFINCQQK